ncbi:thioesterase family protein [Flavihumibacter rivuli]|uniref:acyl-CoA thioesterase n=1 Tax=Flavihumibacter rivuli TaxID=2838156 RepID=UPI001BDF5E69|nr:thioesterase family protein [Flavihumibacter rivuli]ULQ58069.1 thioesterase family protein [Flavihumibacter rivuli]
MARLKLDIPNQPFPFQTIIPVRITDLNYGGHVGNDTILSMIHEARVQYLASNGYSELSMAGVGLIMGDVGIEYKSELFYGDQVVVAVCAGDFSRVGFDLYYILEKSEGEQKRLVAIAKTGMVCYNYQAKKIAAVPEEVKTKLSYLP